MNMRRTFKPAAIKSIMPHFKAAMLGLGALTSSAALSFAQDGVQRSLRSEMQGGYQPISTQIAAVEPYDLVSKASYADQTYYPQQRTTSEGHYISTPAAEAYIPQPMPEANLQQPMHFQAGTPVVREGGVAPYQYPARPYPQTGAMGPAMPADCCMGCDRSFYVNYDAIWFKRAGDEGFSMSQGSFMDESDYDFSGRYTFGQLFDCVDGVEGVYTGRLRWTRAAVNTNAPATSLLIPAGTFNAADLDAFSNANSHTQIWQAQYQNYEFSRRWWAQDIMSSLIGFKMIQYKEQYAFDSVPGAGPGLGIYRRNVENLLLGVQAGGDMFFPISQRLSIGAKARAGVFANFNEGQTFLSNRGALKVNNFDKDVDVSGIIETGTVARYRILPSVVASAGYEFWYLMGVATVPRQGVQVIAPLTGSRVSASDEVLMHGATAGLEVSF